MLSKTKTEILKCQDGPPRVLQYITLDMVSAGLHCSLSMSKQIFPLLFMFGWNTLVLKATCKQFL